LDALSLCTKKAPATKEKYIRRLIKFLDFLGYQGTKEEKARAFGAQAKADPVYAFNCALNFFQSKREQIDRKEMTIGTVRNYVKSIKLFWTWLTYMYLGQRSLEDSQEQRGSQMIRLRRSRKYAGSQNIQTAGLSQSYA
jgi:hypothetical protein